MRPLIQSLCGPSPKGCLFNHPNGILYLDPYNQASAGGLVTQVSDRLAGANHFASAGTTRPTTSTINGRPAFRMANTQTGGPLATVPITTARTVYLVYKRNGTPAANAAILGSDGTIQNLFNFAGTGTDMFTANALAALTSTGYIRVNGRYYKIITTGLSDVYGVGATQKPAAASVLTLAASASMSFNSIGVDRCPGIVTNRCDDGDFGIVFVSNAADSVATMAATEQFMAAEYGITKPPIRTVVCSGNSLTFGVDGSIKGNGYPEQMIALLGGTDRALYNYGLGGQTTTQMIAGDPTYVDPSINQYLAGSSAGGKSAIIGWEGSNELYASMATAQVYANLVTYYQARVAAAPAGTRVGIGTIISRSQGLVPAGFYGWAATVNASLRSGATIPVADIVDFDANPNLAPGWELLPGNSLDGTHMTAQACGYAATTAAAWVQSVAP